MTASARVLDRLRRARRPMRLVGASGQLGYGIPTPALEAAIAREPDLIGADMGSIDIGPTYLGKGEMATAPAATRRDLRKLLLGGAQAGRSAGDRLGRLGRRAPASGRHARHRPRHRPRRRTAFPPGRAARRHGPRRCCTARSPPAACIRSTGCRR